MSCDFHRKLMWDFIDSGKEYTEFPPCDKVYCFHFHPLALPESSKQEEVDLCICRGTADDYWIIRCSEHSEHVA